MIYSQVKKPLKREVHTPERWIELWCFFAEQEPRRQFMVTLTSDIVLNSNQIENSINSLDFMVSNIRWNKTVIMVGYSPTLTDMRHRYNVWQMVDKFGLSLGGWPVGIGAPLPGDLHPICATNTTGKAQTFVHRTDTSQFRQVLRNTDPLRTQMFCN